MKPHALLKSAIAATLGAASVADAAVVSAVLQSVTYHTGNGTRAADVSSSTATWLYDNTTEQLTQTGGLFDARFGISPTATLYRHSITGLLVGGGSAASASSYNCTEGNFGGLVGANLCGNYTFGANFIDESAVSWGPGTATAGTLGGDDVPLGAPQGIGAYDNFVQLNANAFEFSISNAWCNPGAPGSANGCASVGGANTGFTWRLGPGGSWLPPASGFTVMVDAYGKAARITNLDILGTRYDVDFYCSSFPCGGSKDTFYGNRTAAIAAADAIIGALDAAGVGIRYYSFWDSDVPYWVQFLSDNQLFTVAYGTSESQGIFGCRGFSCPSAWWRRDGNVPETAVRFSLTAAVPIPAAAWLFGGALLALGGLRRRQAVARRNTGR